MPEGSVPLPSRRATTCCSLRSSAPSATEDVSAKVSCWSPSRNTWICCAAERLRSRCARSSSAWTTPNWRREGASSMPPSGPSPRKDAATSIACGRRAVSKRSPSPRSTGAAARRGRGRGQHRHAASRPPRRTVRSSRPPRTPPAQPPPRRLGRFDVHQDDDDDDDGPFRGSFPSDVDGLFGGRFGRDAVASPSRRGGDSQARDLPADFAC
jgi:hypothetical protein